MLDKIFTITCFVLCVTLGNSSLAPFITPCKWDDTKCLQKSTQKAIPHLAEGIPELGVDTLDPLKIASIDASSPNLKLDLTDVVITGLKNCEAKKVVKDIEISKIFMTFECNVELDSKYDMNGKISVLPLEGKGNIHADLKKFVIHVDVDWIDKVGKDGKKYWSVKSWKHNFELLDDCAIKFSNIFPNNELLRKTTNDFIAAKGNCNIIVSEIGPAIVQYLLQKIVEALKHFFNKVPVEELAIE